MIDVILADSREALPDMAADSLDACVCDPPYALVSGNPSVDWSGYGTPKGNTNKAGRGHKAGFMGKKWDTGETAFAPAFWREVYRVLKPGAHVVAFGGTRTYHRLVCAIEDAGFEIRDQLAWVFGSGFPKSHNAATAITKQENPNYEIGDPLSDSALPWQGWGTALKPAWEPICLARKPLIGTVAANVLKHGTGAINVDACRVEGGPPVDASVANRRKMDSAEGWTRPWMKDQAEVQRRQAAAIERANSIGRWPANLVHDGSEEVVRAFPESESQRATVTSKPGDIYGGGKGLPSHTGTYGFDDAGSAARFFYTAKADADDRLGSKHPTVKPVDLMAWLVKLVTPPGGTVLDPFAGSGTTGMACMREGFNAVLIEREAEYVADIKRRLAHVKGEDAPLFMAAQ